MLKKKIYINIIFAVFLIFSMLFINTGNLIYQNNNTQNTIEHLCFNPLISFPEKALSTDNKLLKFYDENKLTINEFKSILNELYLKNFMLINYNDFYDFTDGKITILKNNFPKNKKPLVLSFENVSYLSNYQNIGHIDKIIIDRNNNIATYTTKKSIQERVQYDNEFIVILDSFINTHPDFSFNNAKGIIFTSGENGILGYNTNHKYAQNSYETKRAKQVVSKLISNGWQFGCNNYKYIDDNLKTDIDFTKELKLWIDEIQAIIPSTHFYASPFGNTINSNEKISIANQYGFNIFFYNNFTPQIHSQNSNIFISKKFICGKTIRNNNTDLKHLFDSYKIYDHTHRLTPIKKSIEI